MSDTPHYALSQDYELMFVLLENGPLLGFVDYEQGSTLRDPVQIKRVADGKYFEYRAGVRGFGYINAFSKDAKDKFVEQCRKYNLSFIVPNAAAEARAEKAEADAREWKEQIPEECPITSLPYFNSFKNSAGVYQPFYGGPCDVYGIPYKDEDGYLCRKRLCLDSMREEDENMCLEVVEEERMIDLGEAEANVARLTKMVDWLAGKCAMHCHDKDRDDILCSDDACDISSITCFGASACDWKEAARRSVADADSEVKG